MRVLMIDDTESDFMLVQRLTGEMRDVGLSRCTTLSAGFAFLDEHTADVLLLDASLPDVDGLATLETLQTRFSALPVIVLSSDETGETGLEAVRHGAQDYLVKGQIDRYHLERSLRCAIERKLLDVRVRQSEVLYRTFAQNFPNGSLIMYDRDLRYTLVDGLGLEELGLSKEFMEGKTVHDVFPPDLAAEGAERMRTALNGDPLQQEITYHDQAIQMNYVPLRDDKNSVIGGMIMSQNLTHGRRAEERFRALLELAPDAMVIVNQAGQIVLVNSQAEHIFGYSRNELTGSPVETLIPVPFRRRHNGHRKAYSHDPRVRMMGSGLDLYALRKDGSKFPVEISLSPIETDDGILFASTIRDITERRQVEEALRQSEKQFRNMFNYAAIGKALVGLDGRFLLVNRALCDLFGYPEPELLAKTFQDITHPEDLDADLAFLRQLVDGEIETYQMEKRYFHKDGHLVWALLNVSCFRDSDGRPVHCISQIQNITLRKEAQAALAEERNLLRTLIDSIPDFIFLKDRQSRFLMANNASITAFGLERMEQLAGKTDFELLPVELARAFYQDEQQVIASGQALINKEEPAIDLHTGKLLWFSTTRVPLFDKQGGVMGLLGISWNITERKHTDDLLRQRMHEEKEFQTYLKALHEITIELSNITDLDTFYRRAVELGLKRLGFDRLGLLLYDPPTDMATGTYGTNAAGEMIDEHHLRFHPSVLTGILQRALNKDEHVEIDTNAQLFSNFELIGTGWNAAAVLWNGAEKLGWLATDNGVQHQAMTQGELNVLTLYALTLGNLLAQKRTQLAVQESETRLRMLALNSPDIIFTMDLARQQITYLNRSEFDAYAENEMISGGQLLSSVHPGDQEHVRAFWRKINEEARSNETTMVEYRLRDRKNQWRWVSSRQTIFESPAEARPAQMLVTVTDITERKQAEERLVQERDLLRAVIDSSPDYIFLKDVDGHYLLSNIAHAQAADTEPDDLVGKTAYDVFPAHLAAQFHADDELVMETGKALINLERRTLGTHQEPRTVLTTKIPLRDKEGQITGMVGISRDITDRKQLEAQTLELSAERGRIKALHRFINDMSHDFRTPLAIISSSLYLLARNDDPGKRELHYRKAEQQIQRMDKLLRDFLQIERLDESTDFSFTLTDITGFLVPLIHDYQERALPKQISLHLLPDGDACYAPLAAVEFARVMTNLLDNALAYTPEGGRITVRTGCQNNEVLISVQDSGIGIAPGDLPHIFERFYRADAARSTQTGGSGLGLPIVRKIIEAHRGTIHVESTPGQGSLFTIKIPVDP